MYYYQSVKDDSEVVAKLEEYASLYHREGQYTYYLRIRNEGLTWNYKRVRRVYLMMGLNLRRKAKKRLPKRVKRPLVVPETPNSVWSMDFVSDALINQRRFRSLTIIDDFSRKSVFINARYNFPAEQLIVSLEEAIFIHGKPSVIRVDNGPEFLSKTFISWCRNNDIIIQYIQPGRPMQNGFIERFNRTYRENILDAYLFTSVEQVNELSLQWQQTYNISRPHQSLDGLPPERFEEKFFQSEGYPSDWKANSNL